MAMTFWVKIHYEDTDFSGAVYHANYYKFIERARSDRISKLGIDQLKLRKSNKIFVVRRISAKFIKPAYFGDSLFVETSFIRIGGASIELRQKIFKKEECIFLADVKLGMVTEGCVIRLPAEIKENLLKYESL